MYKSILIWLMHTRFYKWLLKDVIPYVRGTTYYTSMRGRKYHEGYANLQPGDIITTVDKKKLTSLLIPGEMAHAAICVGLVSQGAPFEVAEMTHTNYTESFFFDICKESDRVVILRCVDWVGTYRQAVIDAALSLKGAAYDVEFILGIEALYCSELELQCDLIAADKLGVDPRLMVDLSDLAGLGRPYLSPDGLLFAKNVICIWDSDGVWTGLMGPEIESLLHDHQEGRHGNRTSVSA